MSFSKPHQTKRPFSGPPHSQKRELPYKLMMARPSHTKHRNRKFNRQKKASLLKEAKNTKRIKQKATRKLNQKENNTKIITENLKFIRNLSEHKLTMPEITALGKGLKFIPTPKRQNIMEIMKDTNDYIRRMRIRYIMRHKKTKNHPFKTNSVWKPRTTDNPQLENYFEATKLAMSEIPIHKTESNMTRAENIAIKTLANNKEITIKPFDKGRGIVIMNTKDYIQECHRQLHDNRYYTKIPKDDTDITTKKVNNIITKMYDDKQIDFETHKYLDPLNTNIRTPLWYLLPKIHKVPPPTTKFTGRPIISGCSSPTQNISEYIDYFIKPIVQSQPTYIKDTTDFIVKLGMVQVPEKSFLVTLDVKSMYTNTPQTEASEAVTHALDSASTLNIKIVKPSEHNIKACLTLIWKHNMFEFNGQCYKRTYGYSMGSPASP